MRFGIRDLFWLTTGASLYAAVLAAYASRGRLTMGGSYSFGVWGLMAAAFAVGALVAARKRGRRLLSVRRWYTSLGHLVILCLFAVPPLLGAIVGADEYAAFSLVSAAFFHAAVEAGGTLVFAEHGLFIGKLLAWDEHRFELRPDVAELFAYYEPNPKRLAPLVFRLPRVRIDEVRAILAEKQPTTDGTDIS